jgi:hypothetical protein
MINKIQHEDTPQFKKAVLFDRFFYSCRKEQQNIHIESDLGLDCKT